MDGLEPTFLKRFIIRQTALPSVDEMVAWLADRSEGFGIRWDDSSTLFTLAERCGRTAGDALGILAVAGDMPNRMLTRELAEEHIFVQAYGDT